jgi:ABC-type transport system substrate-binding protein
MKTVVAGGEADIAHNFAPSDVIEFLDDPAFVVDAKFNSGREAWWFNLGPNAHPAVSDPRARRAIALGLDRALIVEELLAGLTEVPESFWDQTPYYNEALARVPYDPEAARALLAEAGWVDADGDGVCESSGIEGVGDAARNLHRPGDSRLRHRHLLGLVQRRRHFAHRRGRHPDVLRLHGVRGHQRGRVVRLR